MYLSKMHPDNIDIYIPYDLQNFYVEHLCGLNVILRLCTVQVGCLFHVLYTVSLYLLV